MKKVLEGRFKWYILTDDGLLKKPLDQWGESHPLSREYFSRDEAIEDYCSWVNDPQTRMKVPNSLVLIEEHSVGFDWND